MKVSRVQTRANYDRLSRWYDLLAHSSEWPFTELGLRALDVRSGERVLEIGSGTGHALLALAQSVGSKGLAWGVDLSPGMCRETRRRLTGYAASPGSTMVLCGDATCLPFCGRAFDAIFMSFALELFDEADLARVLSECRRLLVDGGRLGIVAMSAYGDPNLIRRMYGWAHERFPAWIDCRPIPVTQILKNNGFNVGSVAHAKMWGLPVDVVVAGKHPYSM